MNPRIKNSLKLLTVPLILFAIYLSMVAAWKIFGLPTDDEQFEVIKQFFTTYGLWVVFIGALIEGFLLLGQYFPGGFIIFLGVISAGKDIPRAIEVVAVVSLAFFISYTLNYWVGKYGWYNLLIKFGLKTALENAKEKLAKQGLNAVIFSYWEPNLASLTATAAGILRISLKQFLIYSTIGIIIWNTFWGTLVFSLGDNALELIGFKYVIIIFLGWFGVLLLKKYLSDRKNKAVRASTT